MTEQFKATREARRDLMTATLVVMVLYVTASYFDANEQWIEFAAAFEQFELDEIPVALSIAAFGLAWYAYRRWRESYGAATRLAQVNDALMAEVHKRKSAQQAKRESEELYRRLVEVSPDAILVSRDQEILFANPAACDLLQAKTPADLAGASILSLFHPDCAARIVRRSACAQGGARQETIEHRAKRFDGTHFPAACSATPISYSGNPAVLIIMRDISTQKKAEETALAAQQAADAANRAKSEFLANMSHELRTPLNSVIGFAELMRGETLGPLGTAEYKEYSQHIVDAGEHLLSLINDVLDMSRIESGKMELQEEEVELTALIEPCLTMLGERARQQGLTLRHRFAGNLPTLQADPLRLKQVMLNLLSNAIKFTPDGGIVAVEVDFTASEGFRLRVLDSGVGMTVHEQKEALERFCQLEGALNRKYQGTGLGLPLTKAFVELHGGSLEITSAGDHGTCVAVHLPASRARGLDQENLAAQRLLAAVG